MCIKNNITTIKLNYKHYKNSVQLQESICHSLFIAGDTPKFPAKIRIIQTFLNGSKNNRYCIGI